MTRPTPKPPSDLSLALTAARDALGDAAAVQRVRAGVLTKIASGAAPSASVSVAGAGAPTAGSMAGTWLAKSLGTLLLTAGAGAAVYHYNSDLPLPAASATQQAAPLPAASAPQHVAPPAVPAVVEEPATPSEPPGAKPAPAATSRAKASAKRNTTPQPIAAAPQPACFDATAEVDLVSRAQQVLRSQPQLALTLLTEHAQRFSCGVLALERDSLRIDAERALGLDAQAREHARELVARYPEAPETRALKQRLDAANSGSDHKTQSAGTPTP